MKRFLLLLMMTLGLSLSVPAQEHTRRPPTTPTTTTPPTRVDDGGWVKFTSDDGRFSVLMPEAPAEKTETTDSAHGPYTTHLFVVKASTEMPSVFLIGWVDYDPSFNFNRQAELEANRDNFVKGVNAKLLSTHPTVINGYSAIEFAAETDDRVFKSRVFMVGRRPYQIVIGSPKGLDDTEYVNRFFNSFKVSLP